MDRNKLAEITDIAEVICHAHKTGETLEFFNDIFTETELETLTKRWRILKMLSDGITQREIANTLKVSLCKVTRGAKILKNKDSVITKHLAKGKNNEHKI